MRYNVLVLMLVVIVGCFGVKGYKNISPQPSYAGSIHEVEDIIFKTDKLIMNKLQENGININEIRIVHDLSVQLDSCFDEFNNSIKMEHIKNSLDEVVIRSNWITAFVVSDNNYVAKSTTSTFISNPEVYNNFEIEEKLIGLCDKNEYIAFITFFGCYTEYFIGLHKNKLYIYKKNESDKISFLSSMPY